MTWDSPEGRTHHMDDGCPGGHARTITIRIDGRPPTPNARRHWRVTALDNETWKSAARIVALDILPRGWTPLARATADVTFIVPDRKARDLDNLVASSKPLTDGLVAAGVLLDDSTDVLTEVRYRCEHRKGETATVYELREAS